MQSELAVSRTITSEPITRRQMLFDTLSSLRQYGYSELNLYGHNDKEAADSLRVFAKLFGHALTEHTEQSGNIVCRVLTMTMKGGPIVRVFNAE